MERPIYLDYNATTPVAPEIESAVVTALRDAWGNASSTHPYGRAARAAIELARAQVASLLGGEVDEWVFTSGGTESDNAAVVGVAEASADKGRHLVISAIEHAAVDHACRYLEARGFETTRIPVDADGRVDARAVAAALRPDTTLVSVMHANNETGVIQPIREIARATRARGIPFHTDAAQSVGKLPVRVDELDVDLLTVAGHKLYAPQGVGALFLRRGVPFGGFLRGAGHEAGRRSGTQATAAIVGLGAACALAERELGRRTEHLRTMRDRLERALREGFAEIVVHGRAVERLPNTLYVAFPGLDANRLLAAMPGVAAGSGPACHSGKSEPSRVLRAMGVPDRIALGTLRLTCGRETTADEIDRAAAQILAATR